MLESLHAPGAGKPTPRSEEAPSGANARGPKDQQQHEDSAAGAPAQQEESGTGARFHGTGNQRHLRAIRALLRGPVERIDLDDIIGCTNAPYVIQELRGMGLELPCERITVKDRDGKTCRPGRYSLTEKDRAKVRAWLRDGDAVPLGASVGGHGA